MAHISIIWDQSSVRIWKIKRSSANFRKEFTAHDVASFLSRLDSEMVSLKITHLRIYVDLPGLDHHIERVPRITKKLREQLLEQRKINMYGEEARVLVSKQINLGIEHAQLFYLITTLPENISKPITNWTRSNGIQLEGIYSLPQAVAYSGESRKKSSTSFIEFRAIEKAGYLIAREASGEVLFFSRMDIANPDLEEIKNGARRLILFVEQEFSQTPTIEVEDLADPDEANLVISLHKQKKLSKLNLVQPQEIRRQTLQRLRHRVFALLSISILISIYATLPLLEKKKALDLRISEIDTEIQYEKKVLNDLERDLQVGSTYLDVIKFCEGRKTISTRASVPSPLLILLLELSNSFPEFVEIDSYEGDIDASNEQATFSIVGRPLTADVDLQKEIDEMFSVIEQRGWSVKERKVTFESNSNGSRFSKKRGSFRKFKVSFTMTEI